MGGELPSPRRNSTRIITIGTVELGEGRGRIGLQLRDGDALSQINLFHSISTSRSSRRRHLSSSRQ